ncbi:MAG: helix-turn-helix domain-containing protein [Promethearchaeota archaeon]
MEKIINRLDKFLTPESRIISTIIIEGNSKIVYSSDNWDITDDLEEINSLWDSQELGELLIDKIKYKIIQVSYERLVAMNLEKRGSIIGFKDDERRIICRIEPGDTILLGLMDASRTLGELRKKDPYLDPHTSLGKIKEIKWATPKVLLDDTQNLQRLGLLKVGLTLEEAKVYLTLLQIGEKGEKVGNLNKKLNIKRTTIYRIIERLINKRWVDKVMERPTGTMIYVARPLNEVIDNIISEREDELKILKSFRYIMGESSENGWIDVSKEYNALGIIGVEKDCGLIIFEYDKAVKEEVIIQAALQLSYEKLKGHLQPDPIKEEFTNPDLKDIKITHTTISDYFGAIMHLKFKEDTKTANNIGTDWIVAAKHVAIPIDDKIYVIWGSEEKFPILLSIILRIS